MGADHMKVWAQAADWREYVEIAFSSDQQAHNFVSGFQEGQPVMATLDDGDAFPHPTMIIPRRAAQELVSALVDAGFRPRTDPPSDARIADLKEHIAFAEEMARKKR